MILAGGESIVVVSPIFGRATSYLTANTYWHIEVEAMRQTATVMDGLCASES